LGAFFFLFRGETKRPLRFGDPQRTCH
jgi:hypothetical protein